MTPTVAILVPAMRGHLLPALVENIHAATPEEHEVLVVGTRAVVRSILPLDDDRLRVWIDRGGTWGCRLNYLYGQTTASYVFCGADDIQFTEGWLSEALKAMKRVDGVVMVADGISKYGTLPLVSCHYIDTLGGTMDGTGAVIHDQYWHNFSERELVETAKSRGRYAYARKSVVEHLHWMAGKAERSDPVYRLGEEHWDDDLALFSRRQGMWEGVK